MQITRRLRNAWQRLAGTVKVAIGRLTGARQVVMQGRSDRVKANVSDTVRGWRRKLVRS
ncbi:MAG TPA: CsbD family protein [Jatrophihabitantaceae bacterium]|nr:CsbD family protein [Jatrophihabitantaceae bacterium]